MRHAPAAAALLLAALAAAGGARAQYIDPARSGAAFDAELRWGQRLEGRFERFSGRLEVLEGDLRVVEVRLASDSVVFPGHPRYTQWAKGEGFLDPARHPEIVLRTRPFDRGLVLTGGQVPGVLTARGIEREVVFTLAPPDCARPGYDCAIRVEGVIERSAFGMTAWRGALQDRMALGFSAWLMDSLD